jgi:hypothetical protein
MDGVYGRNDLTSLSGVLVLDAKRSSLLMDLTAVSGGLVRLHVMVEAGGARTPAVSDQIHGPPKFAFFVPSVLLGLWMD